MKTAAVRGRVELNTQSSRSIRVMSSSSFSSFNCRGRNFLIKQLVHVLFLEAKKLSIQLKTANFVLLSHPGLNP